ncbi:MULTISPECIES: lysophospholipid acyltransferase family protein [Streptomyces violaceusniger group]|uniref:Lysophospholipid acyltransferase family protein n=2 Tax=Streptomyces violaceusniger group TaxID=2839105 RepID=A0ABD5J0N7_9ACTN|nr:lysophospholipid acyltransferase family protein [Streptomyces violaceusniger]MEE4581918.1 lysophospholipid acyltransferase family protein [Streptomyces sp. DSM 41602]
MTDTAAMSLPEHAWAGWSPCTPECVSHAADRVPATRGARRAAVFVRAVTGAMLSGRRIAEPETLRARAATLLDSLGIRLEVTGDPTLSAPGGTGTLVVANHISWLDILALLAVEPVVMLAKREIAGWPLIGSLATRAGTLYIDRGSLRELPDTVREMAARMRDGQSVMAFPQGITWCSGTGGSFRRATFQAALDAGAPVRPVTLEYVQHGAPTTVAAFVGEDDFGGSLRRVLRADGLTVRVAVHRALRPMRDVDDRRRVAAQAQATVCGARLPLQQEIPALELAR